MDDDLERLNRLLDDLAAERDPRDRGALSSHEVTLAETAAALKAGHGVHRDPTEAFIDQLGARLIAALTQEDRPRPDKPAFVRGISRRALLGHLAVGATGLAAGAGVGLAAGSGVGAAAYERGKRDGSRQEVNGPFQTPLVPADRGVWLDIGYRAAVVGPGQAVRFEAGALAGFVVNPGGDRPLYALSAACTHMGCLLSWIDSASSFLCPCHGAQYNADGTVLSGITRHPLPRLRLHTGAEGRLFIWGVTTHPHMTARAPYTRP